MQLFVPGRICLFGEHSDWAGGYRRINGELEQGYAIIAGTNQGLHARVKSHPSKLIFHSSRKDGSRLSDLELPMDRDLLLAEAQRGGFFSYAAGVAYQVLTHYRVRGLEIDNYLTDLPVKKGLSSSAAACVLVARAFNRIYDLKMTVRGEMEFAYLGEITTPSRCGRMDQGCAYGGKPVMMAFDGDRIEVNEITIPSDLHYVIVDLCKGKDTREILKRLNHSYPFAEDEIQKGVQHYLGTLNARITRQALEAFQEGDARRVGELMREAQAAFDTYCIPACPAQLTAPALHRVLDHDPIQHLVYGGKGVGSQGDGSAQFIVKDAESQHAVMEILERDLGVQCLKLVIKAGRRVRKAIIPAAGFGTRLFPATKTFKKEFFPIMGKDGRMKPVILDIVEEAANAGIADIGIITQERDTKLFEDFFCLHPPIEHFNKLSKENQEYSSQLIETGRRVTLLTQDIQEGFGHAVYCGKQFVKEEPFLLMLGDHVYSSAIKESCTEQLLKIYEKTGKSVVGLRVTPEDDIRHYGCVSGVWNDDNTSILEITQFMEKPDREYAKEHLRIPTLKPDTYLSLFGLYILTPRIFALLAESIARNQRDLGEIQLTPCLDRLRQEEGFAGYVVQGERYDVGIPSTYRQTMIDFGK